MTDEVEILSANTAIPNNTSPTGQKYRLENVPDTSLFRIRFDGGAGGSMPTELLSAFTSEAKAQIHLTRFLQRFWLQSENSKRVKKVA